MSADESLMPGPEGKTPRFYEVDRGNKTESYIHAVSGNSVLQPGPSSPKKDVKYTKVNDSVEMEPPLGAKNDEKVGLTEAELQQYRDDRTWRIIRLFLFILFWILWVLMFAVAIALVVMSPGCAVRVKLTWWQTAVNYNVWVPSFQDSDGDGVGDVTGLMSRLRNLRKSGVQTIWPNPFLLSDDDGLAVRSFDQMERKIGVNQEADKLIQQVHDSDMYFVMSLPIATTSLEHEWFLASASASKEENRNYSQFYHWSNSANGAEGDFYSKHKNLFYLHEKGNKKAAVLNWQTSHVRNKMFDVMASWIDRGVDGFHLNGIEYLARIQNGTDTNWQAVKDIIRDIRNHVDTYAAESKKLQGQNKKIAIFANREDAKERDKKLLASGGLDTVVNYELGKIMKDSDICHKNEGTVATCVHEIVSDVLLFHTLHEDVWPHWENTQATRLLYSRCTNRLQGVTVGNAYLSRIANRAGSRAHAELMSMLQLVLPGTNNVYYGEEIGQRDLTNSTKVSPQRGSMQWDDTVAGGFSNAESQSIPTHSDYVNINWKRQYSEEKSPLKMFSKLAKLRQRDDTMMRGKTLVSRLMDGAFTVTRFLQDKNETVGDVYVSAINFAIHPVSLPLADLPCHANLGKAQIITTTSNVGAWYTREPVDFSSKSIRLDPDQGVVFKYPSHPPHPKPPHE